MTGAPDGCVTPLATNAICVKLCDLSTELLSVFFLYVILNVPIIGADFRFEVPGQSSVGLISGGRGQWLGGTVANAEHEPVMGVWE